MGNPQDEDEVIVVVEATPLFQTTMRQKLTPYLPPPMVLAMRRLDPELEPYIGPEASMTILSSVLLGFLFLFLGKLVLGGSGGAGGRRGKAIQNHDDDDDDNDVNQGGDTPPYFDATVVLCGPSLAGKTSLYYRLVPPPPDVVGAAGGGPSSSFPLLTVKSLKRNIGYWEATEEFSPSGSKVIRVMDLPGRGGVTKVTTLLKEQRIDRLVVVTDATQPVSKVADYLYPLLSSSSRTTSPPILIACHKANAPKAKNCRRIKIQLRTELERLMKLDTTISEKVDWDAMLSNHVGFLATTATSSSSEESSTTPTDNNNCMGLDGLRRYCATGDMPEL